MSHLAFSPRTTISPQDDLRNRGARWHRALVASAFAATVATFPSSCNLDKDSQCLRYFYFRRLKKCKINFFPLHMATRLWSKWKLTRKNVENFVLLPVAWTRKEVNQKQIFLIHGILKFSNYLWSTPGRRNMIRCRSSGTSGISSLPACCILESRTWL